MKSVAVFVKNLTSGGAEKQAVLLAKSLSKSYKTYFVIFNEEKIHKKYLDLLLSDERISVISFQGSHLKRFCAFVNFLKEKTVDIIFSYLTAANFYSCFASLFCKTSVVTGLRNSELPFGKRMADRMLTNFFAKMTVANCYSGKANFVEEGFASKKIEVVPNCFEDIAPYCKKETSTIPRIITVGRFVEQKDYETAIKSVALLRNSYKSFIFTIVGYGGLETQIRKWLTAYNIEDITEVLINPDNIAECLKKSDVYLSTSLFEGTSNSIMEAMNADLPVVATNVGDNPFLVKDGINGYLVPVRDANSIAKFLGILLADEPLRQKMGFESKQHLLADYSMDIFRDRYCKIIDSLDK